MDCLKQEGTTHCSSDLVKILVKTGASGSAQDFKQTGETVRPCCLPGFLSLEESADILFADLQCRQGVNWSGGEV